MKKNKLLDALNKKEFLLLMAKRNQPKNQPQRNQLKRKKLQKPKNQKLKKLQKQKEKKNNGCCYS